MNPVANDLDINTAITLYDKGLSVRDIAAMHGASERTIYRRMASEPQWRAAIEAKVWADHDQAKIAHDRATQLLADLKIQLDDEGVTGDERNWRLAHARAVEAAADRVCKRAAWELERVLSRIYATAQHVEHTGAMQIEHTLAMDAGRILDVIDDDAAQHGQLPVLADNDRSSSDDTAHAKR